MCIVGVLELSLVIEIVFGFQLVDFLLMAFLDVTYLQVQLFYFIFESLLLGIKLAFHSVNAGL